MQDFQSSTKKRSEQECLTLVLYDMLHDTESTSVKNKIIQEIFKYNKVKNKVSCS